MDNEIDFSQLISDNELESDFEMDDEDEDELLEAEEVDIYQYQGLPSELQLD